MSVIFIHGLGQTQSNWDTTIENIAEESNFYCPNLCDLLKGKKINYVNLYSSFAKYCDNIAEPLNLCGLSLGAVLALNYAIDNPEKVDSMVLIAAQYKMPKTLLKFQNLILSFMPTKMFDGMGFSKKEFILLSKSMIDIDFTNDLDCINCPVLLLCGEKDNANRKATTELHKRLKNSSYEIVENSSHEVNIDNPKKLAALLCEFLSQKQ